MLETYDRVDELLPAPKLIALNTDADET